MLYSFPLGFFTPSTRNWFRSLRAFPSVSWAWNQHSWAHQVCQTCTAAEIKLSNPFQTLFESPSSEYSMYNQVPAWITWHNMDATHYTVTNSLARCSFCKELSRLYESIFPRAWGFLDICQKLRMGGRPLELWKSFGERDFRSSL